jgi:hypothetical protein
MVMAAASIYEDKVQGEVLRILAPDDEQLLKTVHIFEKVRQETENPAQLACFFEQKPCNVKAILGQDGKQVCHRIKRELVEATQKERSAQLTCYIVFRSK